MFVLLLLFASYFCRFSQTTDVDKVTLFIVHSSATFTHCSILQFTLGLTHHISYTAPHGDFNNSSWHFY